MRYGRVQLPEEMVKRVEQVISNNEELGYASIDDFVEDSVRRRLEAVKSRRANILKLLHGPVRCPYCGQPSHTVAIEGERAEVYCQKCGTFETSVRKLKIA